MQTRSRERGLGGPNSDEGTDCRVSASFNFCEVVSTGLLSIVDNTVHNIYLSLSLHGIYLFICYPLFVCPSIFLYI